MPNPPFRLQHPGSDGSTTLVAYNQNKCVTRNIVDSLQNRKDDHILQILKFGEATEGREASGRKGNGKGTREDVKREVRKGEE